MPSLSLRPRRFLAPLLAAAALAVLALPVAASAEMKTFLDPDDLPPAGDANGTFGPANEYPATIAVAGLSGKVLEVSATVFFDFSPQPNQIDLALVGPNGGEVRLMSDACGHTGGISSDDWTFTDSALGFLSSLSCASNQVQSFRPTNYQNEFGPEEDDFSVAGGPTGPFENEMAALAGGIPNGAWKLYALDDENGVIGFGIDGWQLNLEIEPGPPAVTSPPPTGAAPVAAPKPGAAPVVTPKPGAAPVAGAKTGKRAQALARCYRKKTARARRRCRRHARTLPV